MAFLRALEDPVVIASLDRVGTPRSDVPSRKPKPSGPRYIRPREATPFSLDPTGDIDPHARALPSPPNQLELLRF